MKTKIDDYFYTIKRFEGKVEITVIINGLLYTIADFKYRNQSRYDLWKTADIIVNKEYQL